MKHLWHCWRILCRCARKGISSAAPSCAWRHRPSGRFRRNVSVIVPIMVTSFNNILDRIYLYCFIAPAHDLTSADVGHGGGHLAPLKSIEKKEQSLVQIFLKNINNNIAHLQHNVFRNTTHSVHIDAFIVVAQQQLHAIWVRKRHNTMRNDCTLSLWNSFQMNFHNYDYILSGILHAWEDICRTLQLNLNQPHGNPRRSHRSLSVLTDPQLWDRPKAGDVPIHQNSK